MSSTFSVLKFAKWFSLSSKMGVSSLQLSRKLEHIFPRQNVQTFGGYLLRTLLYLKAWLDTLIELDFTQPRTLDLQAYAFNVTFRRVKLQYGFRNTFIGRNSSLSASESPLTIRHICTSCKLAYYYTQYNNRISMAGFHKTVANFISSKILGKTHTNAGLTACLLSGNFLLKN